MLLYCGSVWVGTILAVLFLQNRTRQDRQAHLARARSLQNDKQSKRESGQGSI